MNEPNWIDLSKELEIPAKPLGLWTRAEIFIQGPILLKMEASPIDDEGNWCYSTKFNLRCSADGDWRSPIPLKRCLTDKAPIGSLIGKIGGSIADRGGDAVFLVGSYCVLEIAQEKRGPLYFTINDLIDGYFDNEGKMKVKLQIALVSNP
jgi:hypothetical protein